MEYLFNLFLILYLNKDRRISVIPNEQKAVLLDSETRPKSSGKIKITCNSHDNCYDNRYI